jgi:D-alanyl-D-alanine carboxypeptidase
MARASGRRPVPALAVLAVAVLSTGASAAGAPPPTLQSVAQQLVQAGAPGAIAVVRTPRSTIRVAYGLARLEPPSRMRVTDRYRVGSVTKSFVATVVLQLAAEHRLRLSDSVERWLPGLLPNGRAITIRELLSHTSGVFDYTADQGYFKARVARPRQVWSPRRLIAIAAGHRPRFRPGTDWAYSNTNYVLLGLVVEAVTRSTLGEQLRARVFQPLGLHSTSYPTGAAVPGRMAHGYLGPFPGVPIPAGGMIDVTRVAPNAWGGGQIVSDVDDLMRFYAALLGGRLLPRPQLAAMRTVVAGTHRRLGVTVRFRAPYGLGLSIENVSCGTAYGHSGDIPGYRTVVWASADGRRVAAIMANLYDDRRLAWPAILRLAERAFCSG